jgi:hypothetical protein
LKKVLIFPLLWWMTLSATNPTHAMLYSAFIPGGGQIYNQAYFKAGLMIGLQSYLVGTALYHDGKAEEYRDKANSSTDPFIVQYNRDRATEYQERRTSDIWWIGITAALSVLDAYVDAHLADFDAQKAKLRLRFEDETISLNYHF